MRIAFDLDGVLCDTYSYLRQLLIRKFNQDPGTSPTHFWTGNWPISPEARVWADKIYWDNEELYLQAKPFEGAQELIQYFLDSDSEIMAITARNPEMYAPTLEWLETNGLPIETVLFTKDKAKAAQDFKIEMFFEDAPHHLEALEPIVQWLYKPAYPYNIMAPGIPYVGFDEIMEMWAPVQRTPTESFLTIGGYR